MGITLLLCTRPDEDGAVAAGRSPPHDPEPPELGEGLPRGEDLALQRHRDLAATENQPVIEHLGKLESTREHFPASETHFPGSSLSSKA